MNRTQLTAGKAVLIPERVRQMDRDAIAAGTPGIELMERAAEKLALEVLRRTPGRKIGLFCGSGNNGGDAIMAAGLLKRWGLEPVIVLLTDPGKLQGDAALAFGRLLPEIPVTRKTEGKWDLIVDALFGTGLDREVEGVFAETIKRINASGAPVISADIPSGVDGRTGRVRGVAVRADVTVTFAVLKPGLLYEPGRTLAGEVVLCDIGLPIPEAPWRELTAESVAGILPSRPADSHKGTYGHLGVLAGSPGMMGAGALCSAAALRTGAGLVSWGYRMGGVPCGIPEVMAKELVPSQEAVEQFLEKKTAAAVGPGLGKDALLWTEAAVRSGLPCVFDADGLNALLGEPERLKGAKGVLTPHPAEAARLLSRTVPEVLNDPAASAMTLAQRTGLVAVLKGSVTTIAEPDGRVALSTVGNSGMATGGSGDVLTGVIGSLLAQGLSPWEAACAGVWLHGSAGDLVAKEGKEGLIASDIILALPHVLKNLEKLPGRK